MEWQEFENQTKKIASIIWDCDANAETINGVKVDSVCKVKKDYWIVIEITQERSLAKLRTDLAKFASVRPYLFSQNIYSECYFVTEYKPSQSLVTTGQGENVDVLSLESLEKKFIDYKRYSYLRKERPFGSAIQEDAETGVTKGDKVKYVPVKYREVSTQTNCSINDVAELVLNRNNIILIGDYGTGKSRCAQELFSLLSKSQSSGLPMPLGINLREHWGTNRWTEIIRRHFDDLGLSSFSDNVIKALPQGGILLILDGFDEIASQT